jgi:hypothetical protein
MFRRQLLPMIGCVAATTLLLALCHSLSPGRNAPAGPKSLHEAAQIANALGLHHRSDIFNGEVTCRLIISTTPLTFERANCMHIGDPDHPCWHGTVAVCAAWKDYRYLADPDHGVVWGEVFLYGDPALIRLLTAAAPVGPNPP